MGCLPFLVLMLPFLLVPQLALGEPETAYGNLQFETCSAKDNYFELALKKSNVTSQPCALPQSSLPVQKSGIFNFLSKFTEKERLIPEMTCIKNAMLQFEKSGAEYHYQYCENEKSSPKKVLRPCVSSKYVKFIHDEFIKAAACIHVPTDEVFPIFARESGFHNNVVSGTGCAGIGQLCTCDIKDMDQQDKADFGKGKIPWSKTSLLKLPECVPFHSELSRTETPAIVNKCGVTTMPSNPARNLLYALRQYRYDRDLKAEPLIQLYTPQLKAAGFSENALSDLTKKLTQTMYNGGWPSVRASFKAFMLSESAKNPIVFWKNFKAHLLKFFPTKNRSEVANYADNVQAAGEKIETLGGKSCFH